LAEGKFYGLGRHLGKVRGRGLFAGPQGKPELKPFERKQWVPDQGGVNQREPGWTGDKRLWPR